MPDIPDLLTAALQVLILSAGVYLLLGFLRTTRGSGLVRGLGVTLLVGGVGLWGFAELLQLDELLHVLRTILQVAVIVLAVLFHPELRRGIVSLGDNKLLGRFLQSHKHEVIHEIAQAMVMMAKKKQGALLAIERKTPLDAYIEGGVRVDAEVNRLLLDSIFHHGNALHDGAVIIRGDRIEAAASLFPLTENLEISKSTGTRHRAALGLTEETDAVTVAVSEENGLISVCKGGRMERRVGRDALEDVLRDRVGADEDAGAAQSTEPPVSVFKTIFRAVFVDRPFEKLVALGLGFLIFFSAYNAVRTDREFDLQIVVVSGTEDARPQAGSLVIATNNDLRVDLTDTDVRVRVRAPRDVITSLKGGLLGGTVRLPSGETGERELAVDEITWSVGSGILEDAALSDVQWMDGAPRVELTRYGKVRITPTRALVEIDGTALGRRREIDEDNLRFDPSDFNLRGPLSKLANVQERLQFRAVTLAESGGPARRELQLTEELEREGFVVEGDLHIIVPVRPRPITLNTIDVEVRLVSLDARDPDAAERFIPPPDRVRLTIEAVGIPVDAGIGTNLRVLAEKHARVWIDASGLEVVPNAPSVDAPLAVSGIARELWLEAFASSPLYEELRDDASAELRVTIEGERSVPLKIRSTTEDDQSGNGSGGDDQ